MAEHDKQGDQRGTRQQRHKQHPQVAELAAPGSPCQQVGTPEQESQFGELGRLKLNRADLDPALGTVHGRPERQHDEQAPDRRQHGRVGDGAEHAGRRPRQQPHPGKPGDGSGELLNENAIGRTALVKLESRRGGEHHHQADAEQQTGAGEKQVVRGERPVEGPSRLPAHVGSADRGGAQVAHVFAASRRTAAAKASPRAG